MTEHEPIEISTVTALHEVPLVSVLMVTYQHEDFIAKAIEGVLAQEGDFPMELIIAEDCSTDRTREIVFEYQKRYPALIRVITGSHNVGGRANFKRSLPRLRGKYVALCEGDDYWFDPEKLRRQLALFRDQPDCSLVFHAADIVDARNSRKVGRSRWSHRSRRFSIEELILGDGGMVPTASIMVRRSVLQACPPWAMNAPVGDYSLVLHAGLSGDVIYLDRCMSVYRANVPQSWTQRHIPTLAHRIDYAQKIDRMLTDLQAAGAPSSVAGPIQTIVSKYYSDVLVRLNGPPQERNEIYRNVRSKLRGSDRFLAWLAVRSGIHLVWMKDCLRKAHTLLRLVRAVFRRDLTVREPA